MELSDLIAKAAPVVSFFDKANSAEELNAMKASLRVQQPRVGVVTATPMLVDALLGMNTRNRVVKPTHKAKLIGDMKADAWYLTASGIGVSCDGVLLDGQHRLCAIRDAGYPPVQFVLALGLDPQSQVVIDRHARRNLADALTLSEGVTFSVHQIAACNVLVNLRGATDRNELFTNLNTGTGDRGVRTMAVLWADEIAAVMGAGSKNMRAAVTAALAVYYRHAPMEALALTEQVKKGTDLTEDDPAYRLRAALDKNKVSGAQGQALDFALTAAAAIRHFNNSKIKLLRPMESWEQAPWRPWAA